MSTQPVLTPEEDLFGRVALFNELVTLDQIVECARTISCESVAGRPRRTLAATLVTKGYLSEPTAGAVAEAVRKQMVARMGQTAAGQTAPPPAPVPAKRRAPAGDSQITVAVESGQGPKGERIWVAVSSEKQSAAVRVACLSMHPNDARAFASACRRLLETGQPNLSVDLSKVSYVPSVIIGELAKVLLDARKADRRMVLLATEKVAAVARMVLGAGIEIRVV